MCNFASNAMVISFASALEFISSAIKRLWELWIMEGNIAWDKSHLSRLNCSEEINALCVDLTCRQRYRVTIDDVFESLVYTSTGALFSINKNVSLGPS